MRILKIFCIILLGILFISCTQPANNNVNNIKNSKYNEVPVVDWNLYFSNLDNTNKDTVTIDAESLDLSDGAWVEYVFESEDRDIEDAFFDCKHFYKLEWDIKNDIGNCKYKLEEGIQHSTFFDEIEESVKNYWYEYALSNADKEKAQNPNIKFTINLQNNCLTFLYQKELHNTEDLIQAQQSIIEGNLQRAYYSSFKRNQEKTVYILKCKFLEDAWCHKSIPCEQIKYMYFIKQ